MTKAQKKMAEMLGLTDHDFQPPEKSEEKCIEELKSITDDIILMLAELIGGD